MTVAERLRKLADEIESAEPVLWEFDDRSGTFVDAVGDAVRVTVERDGDVLFSCSNRSGFRPFRCNHKTVGALVDVLQNWLDTGKFTA